MLLESRIDDSRNVELAAPWTGFTQFTALNAKPPDGYTWSGGRLTKVHSNIKARLFMARDLVRNGERKNEQWAVEKPKLNVLVSLIQKTWKFREKRADNAGIASGSSHLGAEKLMAKTNPMYCISGNVCFVEPLESTGKRLERTLPKDHEDRIAGKGFNWLGHHNLVHKFMSLHQAMQIPDAEAAVEKEWEKLENLQAWQMTKVKSKSRGHSGSTKIAKNSPFYLEEWLRVGEDSTQVTLEKILLRQFLRLISQRWYVVQ